MRISTKFLHVLLVLALASSLASCMTYTYADAKKTIPADPSVPEFPVQETKLSALRPPEEKKSPVEPTPSARPPLVLLKAALVPLPCNAEDELLDRILEKAAELQPDLIGYVGDAESIAYITQGTKRQTIALGDDRLLVTDLELLQLDTTLATLAIDSYDTITIGLLNLQESTPFRLLRQETDPTLRANILEKAKEPRLAQLIPLQAGAGGNILLLASLGEPSLEDWFETAQEHPYRTRLPWPLSSALEERGFLDSWRATHYSKTSDPGTTWLFVDEGERYEERVDFLFAKNLIPVGTDTIEIGPLEQERLPYEQRWAVTGTFLLP